MYPLGSLLISIGQVVSYILTIYGYIVIAAVVVTWVDANPYNPVVKILRQSTEPVFRPIRRILPHALFRTGLDFTPMIVLLLIWFLKIFAVPLLFHYGQQLIGTP